MNKVFVAQSPSFSAASSTSARWQAPRHPQTGSVYSATKAAIDAVTKSLIRYCRTAPIARLEYRAWKVSLEDWNQDLDNTKRGVIRQRKIRHQDTPNLLALKEAYVRVHGGFSADAGQFGVLAQEQEELKAIVDSTRADFVVEPEA